MQIVDKILKEKLGVTKAIAFNTISRAIQGVGGIVTVFLVAKFLTGEEQGYYFTFTSILSIQVFIELGLGDIVTQFVAHEFAFLKIDSDNNVYGEENHLKRLSSLVRFFTGWYLVASILLFCLLLVIGFNFFRSYSTNDSIEWELPWIILIVATSLNLLLSPVYKFLQGINRVKDVAFVGMITQINSLIIVWTVLVCGGKLYTAAISSLTNVLISSLLLYKYKGLICNYFSVLTIKSKVKIEYLKEIFPYQWRIALSWLSGYFIFQLFNPVLFAYCSPEAAGKMGMTLTVLNGILGLTLSWTSTNVPSWSSMIAVKNYKELDISFNRVLKASSLVCFLGILFFLFILLLMRLLDIAVYDRFLPIHMAAILSSTIFFANIINAWATYLRCHKKEPFLIQAVVVGICNAISTILMAKYIGVNGVVVGYASIVLFISMPLSYHIFLTKKEQYNV